MIPKPFYLQRPKLSFLVLLFFIHLFPYCYYYFFSSKFKYSRTEDSIKQFCDDVIVNLGSPPAERYTVTNLEPDTFYNFSFNGMSSCRQRLSQMIKAKTFASGKLGLISYLYVFLLQRKNNFHPI